MPHWDGRKLFWDQVKWEPLYKNWHDRKPEKGCNYMGLGKPVNCFRVSITFSNTL